MITVPAGNACDGILIYEVASDFGSDNEGFALKNYGSSAVDLNGYYLYDNASNSAAHRYTISTSITLNPGKTATFVKTKNSDWYCTATTDPVYSFKPTGTPGGADH